MDMSFTQDPDWIKQREELWRWTVEKFDIATGLSTKRINALHHYFLTGNLTKGNPPLVRSRLCFFPVVNKEGVAHVLKYNMPEGANDKDIESLKIFFGGPISTGPGVKKDDALELFYYVFGERYNPDWQLPFLIDDEKEFRRSHLDPNNLFAFGASMEQWWRYSDMGESIWVHLLDYWFSLIPHVEPVLFRPGDSSSSPPNVHRSLTQNQMESLLGKCAHQIDPSDGAAEGEERRRFMQDLRARMEVLDGPEDLLALWQTVKDTDPEEFL